MPKNLYLLWKDRNSNNSKKPVLTQIFLTLKFLSLNLQSNLVALQEHHRLFNQQSPASQKHRNYRILLSGPFQNKKKYHYSI